MEHLTLLLNLTASEVNFIAVFTVTHGVFFVVCSRRGEFWSAVNSGKGSRAEIK